LSMELCEKHIEEMKSIHIYFNIANWLSITKIQLKYQS